MARGGGKANCRAFVPVRERGIAAKLWPEPLVLIGYREAVKLFSRREHEDRTDQKRRPGDAPRP